MVWRSEVKLLSHVRLLATPWTVAYKAPQSMGFSRQEYWKGVPFPSPGDLPNPGIEPESPTLQADALPSEPPGKPLWERKRKTRKCQDQLCCCSGKQSNVYSNQANTQSRKATFKMTGKFGTFLFILSPSSGFPDGSDQRKICLQCGRPRFDPGSGRSHGEGYGNPLQYSCLENPMDWGTGWATVHGVAESQTWLSNLHFFSPFYPGTAAAPLPVPPLNKEQSRPYLKPSCTYDLTSLGNLCTTNTRLSSSICLTWNLNAKNSGYCL